MILEERKSEIKAMLPPWKKYPEIPKGSVGWRMGYGEEYLNEFWKWYSALSELEKNSSDEKFPEPEAWAGFYARVRAHPWL